MQARIKELLSNTFLFTLANLGSKILVFLMVPLYTSILTTEEYGISDLVHTTSTLLYPILTCMIAEAVLRFAFIHEFDIHQVFSEGVRIVVVGILVSIILCIIFFKIPFFSSLGIYTSFIPILFCVISGANFFHRFARGINQVKASAYAGLLNTIVTISTNILFLLVFKWGVFGFLLAFTLGDLSVIIYLSYKCRVGVYWTKDRNVDLKKQMLKYSMPLIPNSLSWWALSSINRYIMLAFIGISSVGIYSATLRIPTILTVLSDIFAQAWLLSALKDYGNEESKRFIRSMYKRYFSLLTMLTAIIIAFSHPLANILLSGEFSSYWYIIPFLFISVFWGALVGFLGSIFSAERKNAMQVISTIIGAIISILFTLLFIKEYGIKAVAISNLVGFLIIWLIRRIAVKKYIDIGLSIKKSLFQGLLLFVEAIFVGTEQYVFGCLCILILLFLNYKSINSILLFAYKESKSFLGNRKK